MELIYTTLLSALEMLLNHHILGELPPNYTNYSDIQSYFAEKEHSSESTDHQTESPDSQTFQDLLDKFDHFFY